STKSRRRQNSSSASGSWSSPAEYKRPRPSRSAPSLPTGPEKLWSGNSSGISENGSAQSHKRTKPLPDYSRPKIGAQEYQPLNRINRNGTVIGFPKRKNKYAVGRTIRSRRRDYTLTS